jgi:integrase
MPLIKSCFGFLKTIDLLKFASSECSKSSIHSLRHSYAMMLLEQGENIKFVQKQLGHSSISTTLDLYGHCLPASGKEAMKRLERTVLKDDFVSKMLENNQKMEKDTVPLKVLQAS